MTFLRLALLVLIAAVAGGLIWKAMPAGTAPVAGPDPIAELIPAEIGGTTQWLLIRGADRSAPILLWLHGGPGSAQMPIHGLTAGLERDFVVVHWDQRGAGKSNPSDFDPATMTLKQFIADARDVTALVRARLGRQPMVVLGHSWGTMLGARLVARWPEDYAGYVGVGQQVDTLRGAALSQGWLREVAPSDLADMEAQGGGMNVPLVAMVPRALAAPEYRLPDYRRWLDGATRGSGPMWDEYLSHDLIAEVPRMPVPMLLVAGARDWNTPVPLVQEWFAAVEAPLGKRMEVFDGSGHAPFLTETDRFVETVRGFAAGLAVRPE